MKGFKDVFKEPTKQYNIPTESQEFLAHLYTRQRRNIQNVLRTEIMHVEQTGQRWGRGKRIISQTLSATISGRICTTSSATTELTNLEWKTVIRDSEGSAIFLCLYLVPSCDKIRSQMIPGNSENPIVKWGLARCQQRFPSHYQLSGKGAIIQVGLYPYPS